MKTNHEFMLDHFRKVIEKPFSPPDVAGFNEFSERQLSRIAVASEYSAAQLFEIRKLLEQLVQK